ncbi:ZIP family zinc transporter [Methanofollis sp. W23]|uniref:zinc transporter ZupT n=1 Tax=Methanofollis sp. W23 TaxID=2817849 RepID=UPI001DBF1793|nr:zinc transporter ZupT [Methanofollis sp. W23]MBP2145487.1 ZIP family zinc transporter [Methanofollis sp. W23]
MMTDPASFFMAFGLTLLAGLSTGLGSLMVFFTRRTSTRFLSAALGFSAGVMLFVSFVELFSGAMEVAGPPAATFAFFCGVGVIALVDRLVPYPQNPHEVRKVEALDGEIDKGEKEAEGLYRTGLLTAAAIALHNVPEGMATFSGALLDPGIGVAIAVAIAIHNIPEGIAVSVPIYYATRSRRTAFLYSLLSGLAEPAGAVVAFLLLLPYLSGAVLGLLFAAVAGIMVFVAVDELLPAAREYGEAHLSVYGLVLGMAVMAGVLLVV